MGLEYYKPIIVMVFVQFVYSGVTLIGRAALLQDLSSRVFVVYRQCIAFLLIAPLAFFSRKGTNICYLGWKSFWWIFLLAFVGVTINQNMYFEGLYLVSSSVASALINLTPATTFILAYIFGLEKVGLRSMRSMGKIIGTVVCVSGAAGMALFKGPKLLNMEFQTTNSILLGSNGRDTWLIGCLLLRPSPTELILILKNAVKCHIKHVTPKLVEKRGPFTAFPFLGLRLPLGWSKTYPIFEKWVSVGDALIGSSCAWSTWLILQVHVSAFFPDHLSLTAWMCLFAALQSGILTFIVEPNANSWKLNSPLQFFCCFYAGLASAFTYFAQAWCISKRGPLFSAMFNPLLTLIITLLACLFLHEVLYTGSLIGGLAVIIGLLLYIVLWGKAKDHQDNNEGEKSSHKEKQNDETTLSTQVSECSIDL